MGRLAEAIRGQLVSPSLSVLAVCCAALGLAGCKENYGPGKPLRAGDAGFEYRPEPRTTTRRDIDAGAGPRLELVVGMLGGEGNLDGLATEARLGLLSGGACLGPSLWVADTNVAAFRRIELSSGAVTTVRTRWEPPLAVALQPWQVISDGAERLFVSDRIHHVVAEISTKNATATIFAGRPGTAGLQNGSAAEALFDSPAGLALTPAGDLYVADTGNRVIRRIDLKSRNVSTVATGFHAVMGLAWAGDAGLFATDPLIDALLRVDLASGKPEVVAGGHHSGLVGYLDGVGRKARFWRPRGLAYLPEERALYVGDTDNAVIRRVSVDTWKVDTVAGRPTRFVHEDGVGADAGFFSVGFIAACGPSVLMTGDDGAVRRVDTKSNRVTTIAGMAPHPGVRDGAQTTGELHAPEDGVLVDPDTMFLAECGGSDVRVVDLKHNGIATFAGLAYVRGFVDGVALDARFSCPSALAYDGKSTIFVADRDNHAVRAVDVSTRTVRTVAGTLSRCGNADGDFETASLCSPSGLAVLDGALYVSDAATHTVRRLDLQARTVTTLSGHAFDPGSADGQAAQARFSSPRGIAALPDGTLVVADRENDLLRKIDPKTGATSSVLCPNIRFNRPRSVSALGEQILVTDRFVVHAFHPRTCKDTVLAGVPGSIGVRLGPLPQPLNEPSAAAYWSASGTLFITDRTENAVLRATLASDALK